ncbi:hypothetical protein [Halorubrum saccharovorum]|nr:hypothetical protein [Halorubrum saccharovorum]
MTANRLTQSLGSSSVSDLDEIEDMADDAVEAVEDHAEGNRDDVVGGVEA